MGAIVIRTRYYDEGMESAEVATSGVGWQTLDLLPLLVSRGLVCMVIVTDHPGFCKSNYHTITTARVCVFFFIVFIFYNDR